jgi:hypothetical protein
MFTEGLLVHTCLVTQHRTSIVQLVWKRTELRSVSFQLDCTVTKYNIAAIFKLILFHNRQKTEFIFYYFSFSQTLIGAQTTVNELMSGIYPYGRRTSSTDKILQEDSFQAVYCNSLISEHSGPQRFDAMSSSDDSRLLEGWCSIQFSLSGSKQNSKGRKRFIQ